MCVRSAARSSAARKLRLTHILLRMSTRPPRGGSWLARLAYGLPALALAAPAAFTTHPACLIFLLLALPFYAAGSAMLLRVDEDLSWGGMLGRGGLAHLIAVLALTLAVVGLIGWPVVRAMRAPDVANALWLSLGVTVLLLLLCRTWPVFGLVWLRNPAHDAAIDAEGSSATRIGRSVSLAWRLTAGFFHTLGSGLAVGIAMSLLVIGALCVAGLCGSLPTDLRLAALLLWALVIAPLVSLLTLWQCGRLLRPDHANATALHVDAPAREHVLVTELSELGRGLDRAIDPYPPSDPASLAAGVLGAAAAGEVDRALDLLRQGADPAAMPALDARDQRSLPMIAATLPDLRLLREIIARGGDVNRAVGGLTPLLTATRDSLQGRTDAVMTLITNGADPRIADAVGNTPLHHAARCADPALAAILLDAGAERDAINVEGHSPLAVAAMMHNEVVLRCLLERGAKAEPPRGLSALIAAMSGTEDRPAPIKMLLKHKARVDGRDVLGRTALHAAALHGHTECVEALLAAGADVNARDNAGVTPLMEAARAGHDVALRRLIARRPAANEVDAAGRTALVIACQSRRATADTVQALLAAGVDPLVATRDGKRALDFAVNAGRWREVALLDPAYPLPASVREHANGEAEDAAAVASASAHAGPDRVALLAQALAQRHYAAAEELLALRPALDAEALTEALLGCAGRIDAQGYALLLRHGLRPDFVDAHGHALLHRLAAARPLPLRVLRLMRGSGASPAGGTALAELLAGAISMDAAARGYAIRMAHDWLDAGADAWRASGGETVLSLAVRLCSKSLVDALLQRGADARRANSAGSGLLHLLSTLDDDQTAITIARSLLRAGADPAARDNQGQSPQGAALSRGHNALAHWLGWSPWSPPGRALRDADLVAAAALGDRLGVVRLLELGLSIDARDAQGCTALIRATGGGHAELATLLIARGADADARASSGITALGAALTSGRIALVDRLLEHGIAVDQRLVDDATPLMLAAALGRGDGVSRLLAHRADVLARDAQGNTALHAAAQYSYASTEPDAARAMLQQLLDAGAEIDARNASGQTPLLVLLGARVTAHTSPGSRALVDAASLLVAAGASVDMQDTRGVGVLHAAAMHGLLDMVRWLIRAGADARLRDTLGRTAHDVALVLGYVDVAAELKR